MNTAVKYRVYGQVVPCEGKLPPQALELEEAVIGAILIEKDAVHEVIDILSIDSFYRYEHQILFQAIMKLYSSEMPIDILTVQEQLRRDLILDKIGGPAFITQLTSRIASAAHIEYHARIVQQKYIQRELIRVSGEINSRAFEFETDVMDLLDYSESEIFNVAQGIIKKEAAPLSLLLNKAIEQIHEVERSETNLSGVPSGYSRLDSLTCGWQRSDLIIVAARPSMGKTAFILSMSINMALREKKSVAIFSLEMSSLQLTDRLICSISEIPSQIIRNGSLTEIDWRILNASVKELEKAPIYIDDTPALSVFELRAKCRRLKRKQGIDIIIVDYLQLMTANTDPRANREQEVSNISRTLKSLAKELDVPVIALSQLNRSVEARSGSKRPQLSDLRESGAIEQDADVVLFIHRPEKYGIIQDEEGNSLKGIAEIILAKHRNGPLGDITLKFIESHVKFVESDQETPLLYQARTYGSKMNKKMTDSIYIF